MICLESCLPDQCLMLPADILCDLGGEEPAHDRAALRMERSERFLCLAPVGDWDAEMLLEGLPRALLVTEQCESLKLMFHEMTRFEDFFLSVLMVLLRRHSREFQSIVLDGLPFWAGARISQAQWGSMLGEGWVVEQSPGMVVFRHRDH